MKFCKAYKIELKPTASQIEMIIKHFGSCRFVYNRMLEERIELYKTEKKSSTDYTDMKKLPALKKEFEWLKEVDSTSLIVACSSLDNAYKNFFNGRGFPIFHKKGLNDSYTSKNPIIRSNHRLYLPKIGEVLTKEVLPAGKEYTTATISRKGSRFFVSILCKVYIQPKTKTGAAVGIDLGIESLASLSTGEKIENPKFLEGALVKLAREQRKLSKMKKGSNNRAKQKIKIANLYQRISNLRKDYLHKATTGIVNRFDLIKVEDLKVANMQKNKYLSRSIASASWSEFIRMLEYKAKWYGKEFIKIAPQNTSKVCSVCGYKKEDLILAIRHWVCPGCGATHDRDLNAALNILNKSPAGYRAEPVDTGAVARLEQENLSSAV